MKGRLAFGAACAALGLSAFCVSPAAVGQEPLAPSAEAGSAPANPNADAVDAGAGAAVAPGAEGGAPSPPTPPPGYMLVPIPADAGADAAPPGEVNPAVKAGAMTDLVRFRYANTWDLNLEGGGGYVTGDVGKWTGFARARAGALIVRNDDFYQFGVTGEYMGVLRRPAFGVQAEYLHLSLGTWIQIGGSIDTKGRPGGMAAVGLSVFGIEGQVREFDQGPDPAFAIIGKIRVPVGIIVYGLSTKK